MFIIPRGIFNNFKFKIFILDINTEIVIIVINLIKFIKFFCFLNFNVILLKSISKIIIKKNVIGIFEIYENRIPILV